MSDKDWEQMRERERRRAEANYSNALREAEAEIATLRARVAELEAQLATARAEERERLVQALLKEAASVSMGATFADGGPLSGASRYNVLRYCANKIDELSSPTPEPPHA